jgi:ornithine cyclodeaminase/alanine dehydrogenase
MKDAISALESAFAEASVGNVVMPQRTVISIPGRAGVQLGMPAFIGGAVDVLALKVVTIFNDNPDKANLPAIIGVVVLDDPATGAPLAIMDAAALTAIRTGAASGIATKYLARESAASVVVVGAGVQGRAQLEAVCAVRPIRAAAVYDAKRERARAFASDMRTLLGIDVSPSDDLQTAIKRADIVVLASSAADPVLNGDWLQPGQHINAIGSHAPARRELDSLSVQRSRIYTDSTSACLAEAGDLLIPIKEGVIGTDSIVGDLAELVAGQVKGRTGDDEITLFKSVGLALEDAAAASFVLKKAQATGVGAHFAF